MTKIIYYLACLLLLLIFIRPIKPQIGNLYCDMVGNVELRSSRGNNRNYNIILGCQIINLGQTNVRRFTSNFQCVVKAFSGNYYTGKRTTVLTNSDNPTVRLPFIARSIIFACH